MTNSWVDTSTLLADLKEFSDWLLKNLKFSKPRVQFSSNSTYLTKPYTNISHKENLHASKNTKTQKTSANACACMCECESLFNSRICLQKFNFLPFIISIKWRDNLFHSFCLTLVLFISIFCCCFCHWCLYIYICEGIN